MKHPSSIIGLLKNNLIAKKKEAILPYSLLGERVCNKLSEKGYVSYAYIDYDVRRHKTVKVLRVGLKYDTLGHNKLLVCSVKSSPARRYYTRFHDLIHLEKKKNHLFLTPTGFLWLDELKNRHMGGEYLLSID